MATRQFNKRLLAVLVLLTLCAPWVPAHAQTIGGGTPTTVGTFPPPLPIIPIRHPHESVATNTARENWNYWLALKGSGFTPQWIPFDSLDARQIFVAYSHHSPGWVQARAYAMANGGREIAVGQPIRAWVPTTLDTLTEERGWWKSGRLNTGWRTTPITPRDGNGSMLTTVGWVANNGPHDNAWLSQAVRSTNYALVRSMMESGVSYFNQRLLQSRINGQYIKVLYERRPSAAWVHYNQSAPVTARFSMDVVQEPKVFMGVPTVNPANNQPILADEMPSAAEQVIRWRTFMLAEAASGGFAEGYALGLTTQKSAVSGMAALLEAEGRNEPIVELTGASQINRLSATTDSATRALIQQALAAPGGRVKVTVSPTTASTGWRGTPWMAWSATTAGSPVNVGTYLGVLRGAQGEAGANPQGTAQADAAAQAATLGQVAAAVAGLGAFFSNGPFGPVGKAIGMAGYALAVTLGLVAAALKVASTTPPGPKQGHVDAAPTTDPTEQGEESLPEGTVTVGPISEVGISGTAGTGVGGVGADGTSGTGGCGCGPGDPGNGLGGEI